MDIFDIKYALEHITLLVDTREQNTPLFRRRMRATGLEWERHKLNFGDYSAKCTLQDGREITLENSVAIERKMSLDELCACFTRERERFTKEFIRAKSQDAKCYLLIENGSWEKAYAGEYRSKVSPTAFTASMQAWLARYNCQILFCEPLTTGRLIHDILYREMKELLEGIDDT